MLHILRRGPGIRRLHRRLGRRRRHGRLRAHRRPARASSCSRRAAVVRVEGLRRCSTRPYASPRRGACDAQTALRRVRRLRSAAGTSTASRTPSAPGTQLRLVARAHARRPHQPLGPHLAALRPRRLQAARAATDSATTGRSRYDDVAPYYDQRRRADRRVRQQRRAAQRARRHLPAAAEAALLRAARQEGARQARRSPASRRGCRSSRKPLQRPAACHYCGQCNRGCTVKANFSSPDVLIAPALADGQAHAAHRTRWRARSPSDATGSRPASRTSTRRPARSEHVARARRRARGERVRVGAPAAQLEVVAVPATGSPTRAARSASTSPTRPAPTSPGFIPAMVDHVPHNEDGVGGMHVYMPWWLDNKKLDFPRGYHIEVWGGLRQPGVRLHGRHPALSRPAAATARSSRTTIAATTARRSASPAAAR